MLASGLFKRSWATRHWFHGSDLASHMEAYIQHLKVGAYAEQSISMYVESVAHLAYWMQRRRLHVSAIDENLIRRFIKGHLPACHCTKRCQRSTHIVRAALNQLLVVLRSAGRISVPRSHERAHIDTELYKFAHYLSEVRGVATSTQHDRLLHVTAFLRYIFEAGPIDVGSLKPTAVSRFITKYAANWTPASKRALANSLRSYFRYKAMYGEETGHLIAAIQRTAQWRMASLPKWLPDKDVRHLLESFDRDTATGRRDYAITRCCVDLGLRASEIARLRLDDMRWREGTVRIRAKGRRVDILPLPGEMGRAIADYLRGGRPDTPDRNLFVRHRAPLGKPVTPCVIRNAVWDAARRCGLEKRFHGPHTLRHTVAKRLLEAGSTLKSIADVLRHRCLDTTSIYAKVDIAALRRVALPWPGSRA